MSGVNSAGSVSGHMTKYLETFPSRPLIRGKLIYWLRNCQLAVKFGPVAWIDTRAEPIRCTPDGSFTTLPETPCA
jgi:hypothetical protein